MNVNSLFKKCRKEKHIEKRYRKALTKLANSINLEVKQFAKEFKISRPNKTIFKSWSFYHMSNHKWAWKNKKNILEEINKDLADHLAHIHSKNTSCVIECFKNLNKKNKCALIQMDIKEFIHQFQKKYWRMLSPLQKHSFQ